MNIREFMRSVVLSWDWFLAFAILVFSSYLVPENPSVTFAKDLFATALSVLAIVFSVFLASLAVLITAGDNEFVSFLEEDGSYTKIITSFKIPLILLSLSLITYIVLYAVFLRLSDYQPSFQIQKWMLLVPAYFGLYSLLATIQSSLNMLKYAEFRARFLSITKNKRN